MNDVDRLSVELMEFLPQYFLNREKDLSDLLSSLKKADFEKIKSISHKISGTAGSYGLFRLEKLVVDLNIKSKKQNLEECQLVVKEIEEYLKSYKISGFLKNVA